MAFRRFSSLRGHPVVEGVLFRSPSYVAIAVRRTPAVVRVRNFGYESLTHRYAFLRRPPFRGVTALFEALFHGIEGLVYSAQIQFSSDRKGTEQESSAGGWLVVAALVIAFGLGVGLFAWFPQWVTNRIWAPSAGEDGPGLAARAVAVAVKLVVLTAYLGLMRLLPEVRRLFSYHSAQHQCLHVFEAGDELTPENARQRPHEHPRCGLMFLLFTVVVAIVIFTLMPPEWRSIEFTGSPVTDQPLSILLRLALLLPVAAFSYEYLRFASARLDQPLGAWMMAPANWIQRLVIREPGNDQLEVGLVALRQVLRAEKGIPSPGRQLQSGEEPEGARSTLFEDEFEVRGLVELGKVYAPLDEFLEK